jgi:hypothetical protein
MAIADYSTLVAQIKSYMGRSDATFTQQIDSFVSMAEDRIYNGYGSNELDPLYSPPVRSKAMEHKTDLAFAAGVASVPSDLLEHRGLYQATANPSITYLSPEAFEERRGVYASSAPRVFTIEAGTVETLPAVTGNLTLSYYRSFTPISSSNTTGPMMTAHGNLYFNSVMFEAYSFEQEPEAAMQWLARYRSAAAAINKTASDQRRAGGRLRVTPRQRMP